VLRLTARQRKMLELKAMEGYTNRQISTHLGVGQQAVESILRRARESAGLMSMAQLYFEFGRLVERESHDASR
jgi:DNA-directed RNA polymerase specialized sigma24 family protein